MDKQANSVRMPPDRILPACVGAASAPRAAAGTTLGTTRFKTTSLLLLAYARDRGAPPARAGRRPRERPTDGPTEPGVRQSSGALAAWYRWQHSSKDGATDSTPATDYCAYRLALEQQQHAKTRGRVAAILREL